MIAHSSDSVTNTPLFPCDPKTKRPYTKNGFYDATTDQDRIGKWRRRWPDALTAMPTGKASGRWVLDIDPRHEGLESLATLIEAHGPLPETVKVKTRSGGWHFHFLLPDGIEIRNSAGKIAPGIDVRATGGYVIIPDSRGWEYKGEARTPVAAPGWLVGLATAKKKKPQSSAGTNATATPELDGSPIAEGTRNASLFSIAGRLHDGTRDLDQLTRDIQEVNERRCVVPLPLEEVAEIAENMFTNYEPCRPNTTSRKGTPPDADTLAALDLIEARIWAHQWGRYKSDRDVMITALKEARLHGQQIGVGVRVSISLRAWAPKAAVSKPTLIKAIKRLRVGGFLRRDDAERKREEAGAVVLLTPREIVDHTYTTTSTTNLVGGGGKVSRSPFSAPRLRASTSGAKSRRGVVKGSRMVRKGIPQKRRDMVKRLGKSAGAMLDTVEANGGSMHKGAIGAVLGVKRPRDMWRDTEKYQGPGAKLLAAGIVEVDDAGMVSLVGDWLMALDIERERGGEIERERQDRENYERDRLAWRKRYGKADVEAHLANAKSDGMVDELISLTVPSLKQLYDAIGTGAYIGTPSGRGKVWQAFSDQVGVVLDATPDRVTYFSREVLTVC
jgi:hypothetical protein